MLELDQGLISGEMFEDLGKTFFKSIGKFEPEVVVSSRHQRVVIVSLVGGGITLNYYREYLSS